jgi:hypothetical protein
VPVFAVSDFARLEALLDAVTGKAESAAGSAETA